MSATTGKASVYSVAASVARNLGLRDTTNHIMNFIEWAFEAEMKIGSKDTFSEKTQTLKIYNKKAKLPCDFYKLIDLMIGGDYNQPTSSTFKTKEGHIDSTPSKYYLDDSYIHFSSASDGTEVDIAYLGVELDENGFPFIEQSHVDAVSAYIMWKHKAVEYYNQKLPQYIYKDLENRWYWLCGQARGNDNMPSQHEMQKVASVWNTLIPLVTKDGLKQF
jgi:hypothetical protein